MSPDRHAARTHRPWSLRSSWGELAFAGVLIAVASGAALALPYDVQRPYDSLAWMLLTSPAAAFFRNVHYWAGQLFLVLTVAHAWNHLARWTETRVPRPMWWRVTLSLPLAAFVMLSGFMLKGDAEAEQALRIVTTLLEQVPWIGPLVSVALFGTEASRQILYVHHVATASILTWLFIAEHARATWPRLVSVVEAFAPVALVSLFLSPSLHDGLEPVVKGPWYFLGLQEALHWTSRPLALVVVGAGLIAIVFALPRLTDRVARVAKRGLLCALVVYGVLTVVGVLFRGVNWSLTAAMSSGPNAGGPRSSGLVVHGLGPWWGPSTDAVLARDIPVVLGRREGCLFCHGSMKGLSRSHSSEAVGCASCHEGNPFSLDKTTAHAGLVLIPGNLASAERACGSTACHPSQVERVSRSLMTTMAGIVAVDRAVWGATAPGAQVPDVASLGQTGADSHLRQLCASCHVGAVKTTLGPNGEDARGGGCNTCHLTYSAEARAELGRYQRERAGAAGGGPEAVPARVHPDLSINIERRACFGCHSRSGRISMSYEGWHEVSDAGRASSSDMQTGPAKRRTLADGRQATFVVADIHARSMDCIDCHTSREVMGDGVRHARQHEAVRVACEDCHRPGPGTITIVGQLDAESRRLAELRGRNHPGERFLATARDGYPLINTFIDGQGAAWLSAKATGQRLPMKAPAAVCLQGAGHARLSCISCHAAWSPRCPQCHTAFDGHREAVDLLDGRTVKGAWVETPGEFIAVPPTLGVRFAPAGQPRRETIDTFIPGMIVTLDRNQTPGARPDTVFRRLYARSFSHTIGRTARACQSCHADPVALGYGEGSLRYQREGARGRWRFAPRYAPGPDGVPADAWIGFLRDRSAAVSTRPDVRPLTTDEQKRILVVGACLTCHDPASPAMRRAVTDWRGTLARVTRQCLLPGW